MFRKSKCNGTTFKVIPVSIDKCYKFNKNVSERVKKGFRAKTFKENVDLIVN
jgi:hypothetical protein